MATVILFIRATAWFTVPLIGLVIFGSIAEKKLEEMGK